MFLPSFPSLFHALSKSFRTSSLMHSATSLTKFSSHLPFSYFFPFPFNCAYTEHLRKYTFLILIVRGLKLTLHWVCAEWHCENCKWCSPEKKSRTRVIFFSTSNGAFIGRNELVDFQYTDLLPHWRHSKTFEKIHLNSASTTLTYIAIENAWNAYYLRLTLIDRWHIPHTAW